MGYGAEPPITTEKLLAAIVETGRAGITLREMRDAIVALRDGPNAKDRRIEAQRRELASLNQKLAAKNRELDAMRWVWCSGGCEGGVARFGGEEPTKQDLEIAQRNVERLRQWVVNRKAEKEREER